MNGGTDDLRLIHSLCRRRSRTGGRRTSDSARPTTFRACKAARECLVLAVPAAPSLVEHHPVGRGNDGVVDALPRPHRGERPIDLPALGDGHRH